MSTRPAVRGFLNIDKPAGMTSFDVVRQLRRAAGTKRVGHAGTLDPLATGVLPIALGDATRFVDELVGATKAYRATIRLGEETDTYDAEGEVARRIDASHLTPEAIVTALARFEGEQEQLPPAYSAIKRDGVPAYRAAREGAPLQLEPRRVTAYALRLLEVRATGLTVEVTLDLECSKGFYVRSLAHDLGAALGVGGHVTALRRTRVGLFRIEDAVPLEEAARLLELGEWVDLVHAPDAVLTDLPAVILDEPSLIALRNGHDVRPAPRAVRRVLPAGQRARCYSRKGELVGLLRATEVPGAWHPYLVLAN